jgi:hypothetical protein
MVKTGRGPDKLQRLVDDFAQTCLSQSIEVPQSMIEHGLRDRIDQVAQHLGITSTAALHIYVDESWGRVMAEQFCADIDVGEARLAAAPDAILAVGFLGRLVASLGQAQFFAAVNSDPLAPTSRAATSGAGDGSDPIQALLHRPMPSAAGRINPHPAADAITGLGLALHTAAGPDLEVAEVEVPGRVLAQTREILEDLARRLEPGPGQWRACGCDGPGDARDSPTTVRDAVRIDLEQLHLALDPNPGPCLPYRHEQECKNSEARVLPFVRSTKADRGPNRRGR